MFWEPQPERQLRAHQEKFRRVCAEILGGRAIRTIDLIVTPGGGKSAIPVIGAAELIQAGYADKVCWMVPRLTLQDQAERAFLADWLRAYLDHDLVIRSSTNDWDPSRGTAGFGTTLQAAAADYAVGILRQEFERHRYILVIDEAHHVAEGGTWHRALAPLLHLAKLVILMSGNRTRADGKPIAFFPYKDVPGGKQIDMNPGGTTVVIEYTRKEALVERAVIPIEAILFDCRAEWTDRAGARQEVGSFHEKPRQTADALFTALRTNFACNMMDKAVAHWEGYKLTHPRAKMLFVAPDIATAKTYLKYLNRLGRRALIATSDDSEDAQKAIARLKKVGEADAIDWLVTVAMAYEGMDVPPLTHIVSLTHIRAWEWLNQMINRGTRFDPEAGAYEDQVCYLFAPDDPEMRDGINKLIEEQDEVIGKGTGPGDDRQPGPPKPPEGSILPLASQSTTGTSWDLLTGEKLTPEEHARWYAAMEKNRIYGVTPLQLKRAAADAQVMPPPRGPGSGPILTPTEEENRMRDRIEDYCRKNDNRKEWAFGETNRQIVARFQKKRGVMTLPELGEVWAWLQANYPAEVVA